jgi:hypothetical protein
MGTGGAVYTLLTHGLKAPVMVLTLEPIPDFQ